MECYVEFDEEFSKEMIAKFTDVFEFFKNNAVDENSLIRRLHLGYTAMRPEAFDFVASEFPWLEEMRIKYNLSKRLNFLETIGMPGSGKQTFEPHIDGKPGDPHVMFNIPLINCTNATVTRWLMPRQDFNPVLLSNNGTKTERITGATPHLPKDIEFDIIAETSFTDRAVLFRSDIYHAVENNDMSGKPRIMMHWWFPAGVTMEQAKKNFNEFL